MYDARNVNVVNTMKTNIIRRVYLFISDRILPELSDNLLKIKTELLELKAVPTMRIIFAKLNA
jgi:CRISPR/Cas system CSM-associated protein Csm2 small subunit